MGGILSGCQDDLRAPWMTQVKVRFDAENAALRDGAELWIDGEKVIGSLSTSEIDTLMNEGRHVFVLRKDCARVQPAESLAVDFVGGHATTVDFQIVQRCALLNLHFLPDVPGLQAGAQVWLDGQLVVESLDAEELDYLLEPGPHSVVVRKECVTISPAESLNVTLEEGRDLTLDVHVEQSSAILSVRSTPSGLPVWIDGAPTGLTTPAAIPCLPSGSYLVKVRPAVTPAYRLSPDTLQTVSLGATGTTEAVFDFPILNVTSNPSELPIRLDGEDTGLMTPASFPCIVAGSHEVSVHAEAPLGFTAIGDTTQTVQVEASGAKDAEFAFTRGALPQSRGVLIEMLTSTFCPNCPVADAAAERLVEDPYFDPEALCFVLLHVRWGGMDPFFNQEIAGRLLLYRESGDAAPIAYFNGLDKTIGSVFEDIEGMYRGFVMETYAQEGSAALYWRNVRLDGNLLRGDLRYVAIEDLAGYDRPQLFAFYAKDSLRTQRAIYPNSYFNGVVREFSQPIDLKRGGNADEGDWLDTSVSFDLSPDAGNVSPHLRLVAVIQDSTTQEVIQSRQVVIRTP